MIYSVSVTVDGNFEKYWCFNTKDLNDTVNASKERKASIISIQGQDGDTLATLKRRDTSILPAFTWGEDESPSGFRGSEDEFTNEVKGIRDTLRSIKG